MKRLIRTACAAMPGTNFSAHLLKQLGSASGRRCIFLVNILDIIEKYIKNNNTIKKTKLNPL
ncbi:MAG TPA: hypothetical protein PKW44_07750, partial [Methylophilaceae bacterium]|nr:hypothetical protein [Methylophilaceae bacterium]